MEFSYEIIEELAVLSEGSKGTTKELNYISYGGRSPKYDIREWAPEHEKMYKGITLNREELYELHIALEEIFGKQNNIDVEVDWDKARD